jgi:hypothetical protein
MGVYKKHTLENTTKNSIIFIYNENEIADYEADYFIL